MLRAEYSQTRKSAVLQLPRVKKFLDGIGRNSNHSMIAYSIGLTHFNNFIIKRYNNNENQNQNLDCESILNPLSANEISVYDLLDSFVSNILEDRKGISPKTVSLYVSAIRSYLAYYDIDVIPSKFKRKVKMPKFYREDEEPIDVADIRKILLSCNNRRLKTLILVLASGGMRVTEALATRYMDLDFSVSPTKIHLRKEYSKTKVARDVYISDEATAYLKQWLDWKYNNPIKEREFKKEDLVFTVHTSEPRKAGMRGMYVKVWQEFQRLLTIAKMDDRKGDDSDSNTNTANANAIILRNRRKITIHSLRRFVKTVISEQAGQDYSEYFLGHSKSPYWTMKEAKRREIYKTSIMKYLTFLDYSTLETTGKNIEAKLNEKDKQIQILSTKYDEDIKILKDAVAD
ncbi:MAG TPA: site-specific integrase, partial [Nitrososphaeraceae archaeon]